MRDEKESELATDLVLAPSGGRPASHQSDPELVFPDNYHPGRAPAAVALYRQMRMLLKGDIPVLICGETGVGKEQIARTLHALIREALHGRQSDPGCPTASAFTQRFGQQDEASWLVGDAAVAVTAALISRVGQSRQDSKASK